MKKNIPTILCVDDDAELLNILEIMLRRRGFHVLRAPDAVGGISLLLNFHCSAAVIDYAMPGINGGELARELRRLDPALPIVLHTGYADIDDPLLAYVDCTIPKGSFAFLMAKLNELLAPREADKSATAQAAEKASAA